MEDEKSPDEMIEDLVARRADAPDDAILAELAALPVLPDDDDPAWDDERTWAEHAYVFEALARIARQRRLRPAIALLLERASRGDPGSMMRGLRHKLEGIAEPDWGLLRDACIAAARSPHPGARMWAIDELGVLRDPASLPILIAALDDPAAGSTARRSLRRLCESHPECGPAAVAALTAALARATDAGEQYWLREGINAIALDPAE